MGCRRARNIRSLPDSSGLPGRVGGRPGGLCRRGLGRGHHEACLLDQAGAVLGRRRVPDGVAGLAQLHGLVADHASEPTEVVVGIELDRGLLVGALVAAGYQVVAVNPLAASRYRERHGSSGAKSDRGTPRSWLTWSAPTATTIGRWQAIATWPGPSGCWPGRTSRPPGAVNASPTACGRRCGPSTQQPWTPWDRPGLQRCLGGAGPGTNPRARPPAVAGQGRRGAGPRGRQRNLEQRAAQLQAALRAPQLATALPTSHADGW
jgi:hypothetical protein